MNRLLILLALVFFVSCSSYNYTPAQQYYTSASYIEEPSQFPNITFVNWNIYSGYWNNYYCYTPYYISPYTTWFFNPFSNSSWNNSYCGWNSGWNNNYNGWNNGWNNNYYGWNNGWNNNYYGWNNGWNNNFGNTYVTNNYFSGKSSNYGGNAFGGFSQKNSSKNEEYKSITPKKNISRSTNSPVRPDKPVDQKTRINDDIRSYQTPKSETRNNYSSPVAVKSSDLRNTQPTSLKTNTRYSTPNRNITREPKVNTYTPSEKKYTKPERVNSTYKQPQRQNNSTNLNHTAPPRNGPMNTQRPVQRTTNSVKSSR